MKKHEMILEKIDEQIEAFHRLALKAKISDDEEKADQWTHCLVAMSMFKDKIVEELRVWKE